MRIATWNLMRPGLPDSPRGQAIMEQITTMAADIWVLTETRADFAPPAYAAVASPAHPQMREHERAVIIWSRWPLHVVPVFQDLPETEDLPTAPSYATHSRATAPAACALIETPDGPLLVYGTIIRALWRPWVTGPIGIQH